MSIYLGESATPWIITREEDVLYTEMYSKFDYIDKCDYFDVSKLHERNITTNNRDLFYSGIPFDTVVESEDIDFVLLRIIQGGDNNHYARCVYNKHTEQVVCLKIDSHVINGVINWLNVREAVFYANAGVEDLLRMATREGIVKAVTCSCTV